MLAKFLFILIFLSPVAWCETRTYLVKRAEDFPQDRYLLVISPQEYKNFTDTGKKSIKDAGGQPYRVTSYEINYSGKYALWTVSFANDDERWHIDSMEKQGYIVLLSSMDIVDRFDPRRGGIVQEAEYQTLAALPTDYYQVAVSTP
jgi:hypothetical protein